MKALYDLQWRLPTYDFFIWLCHVKLLGATEIVISRGHKFFMRKKWPSEETERRLENYIRPGPALLNLPCTMGTEGEVFGSHLIQELWADARALGVDIPRLHIYDGGGGFRSAPTVTIRETFHKPERNSDRALWLRFAYEIDATVIEDSGRRPISLFERMLIYQQSRMNFGVSNGPLMLCHLSNAPLVEFCDPNTVGDAMRRQGIKFGAQLPWARTNQRIVWAKPTMDLLMEEYESRCLMRSSSEVTAQ